MPFGTTTAGAARLRLASELPHDELEKQQRGFGGLLVFGEVAEDAALLLAAERRIGQDDIDPISLADFGELESEGCCRGSICGRFETVQQQIHLASRYGSGFGSPPKMLCVLQDLPVLDGLALLLQMLERLNEKPAGAAGRIEHRLRRAADR